MIAKRPFSLYLLTLVLLLLAVNALIGGYLMISDPTGAGLGLKLDLLDTSPFSDYAIPGAFLFIVLGLGGIFSVYGLWLRPDSKLTAPFNHWIHEHWTWSFTLLFGVIVMAWILIQYLMVRAFHPLQALIGGMGLAIIGLDLLPDIRRYYAEN